MGLPSHLKRFLIAWLILFLTSVTVSSAGAWAGARASVVPLMADPKVNRHRVKSHLPTQRLMAAESQTTSTITINFLPQGSDPDGMGDTCATWPDAPKAAFNFAVAIWQAELNSSVPIVIDACWATGLDPGVLGQSGPLGIFRNFTNAPQANTWYPSALANSIAGADQDPATADIYMAFSSTFSWYFGTDGNAPDTQYDFVSVVLHEICHGLGFLGTMDVSGGSGSWGISGFPIIYDRFTQNGSGQSLLNAALFPNPSIALGTQLTSNNLFFSGANANAANGGTPAKLYAPLPWKPGSSYSHLDEIFNDTPNALMTFSLNKAESVHDPGPVALGILSDIGWQLNLTPTLSVNISGDGSVNSNPGGVACTTGNAGTCSAQFSTGLSVTLTASGVSSPTILSHFGAWTGECNSTSGADCSVTMIGNKSATATFITNQPVQIPGGLFFSSLQAAYDAPGATGITILSQAVQLAPLGFNLDKGKSVTLNGGYDSSYSSNGGYTTLDGSLTLTSGSLTVKNLIIR